MTTDGAVSTGRDNRTLTDQNSADRHLASGCCHPGLFQRNIHESTVHSDG
jgi:hypothetical protein